MALKVYVSGMSGNKEVKKRQQRVLMILDSKNIKYDLIDITEPGKENEKEIMQTKSTSNGATVSDPDPRHPLPPQIFNAEDYCGDYDAFDLANEIDTLEQFLKIAPPPAPEPAPVEAETKVDAATTGEAETDAQNNENKTENGEVTSSTVENGGGDDDENKENKEGTSETDGQAADADKKDDEV